MFSDDVLFKVDVHLCVCIYVCMQRTLVSGPFLLVVVVFFHEHYKESGNMRNDGYLNCVCKNDENQ